MLTSTTYKYHFWLPPRIASRSLYRLAISLGFENKDHYHICEIKDPKWGIVVSTRNPYSRAVSWWNLKHNDGLKPEQVRLTFEQFLKYENDYFGLGFVYRWDPLPEIIKFSKHPDYIIRWETLYKDIENLPFDMTEPKVVETMSSLKTVKSSFQKNYVFKTEEPYSTFYNQELADIVWNRKKQDFLYWGYDRDSWMEITD